MPKKPKYFKKVAILRKLLHYAAQRCSRSTDHDWTFAPGPSETHWWQIRVQEHLIADLYYSPGFLASFSNAVTHNVSTAACIIKDIFHSAIDRKLATGALTTGPMDTILQHSKNVSKAGQIHKFLGQNCGHSCLRGIKHLLPRQGRIDPVALHSFLLPNNTSCKCINLFLYHWFTTLDKITPLSPTSVMRTFWPLLIPIITSFISIWLANLPKPKGHLLLQREEGPPDGSEDLMFGFPTLVKQWTC